MIDRIRTDILAAHQAALAAINPEILTRQALASIEPQPTTVIAIGKAAAAMTRGSDRLSPQQVLVVCDESSPVPAGSELLVGSHPVPDAASQSAALRALEVASAIPPDHLALFLISGGGSSLAEIPAGHLTLSDLATTFDSLTKQETPIATLNLVRRHLSRIKNGRLLAARGEGRALTLVVSDVIDGPASDVASGPTLADGSRPADAYEAIRAIPHVPQTVLRHLREAEEPPPAGSHQFEVIADRHTAARGAAGVLSSSRVLDSAIAGNANSTATAFCSQLDDRITIATGETTVRVTGQGKGGRNQSAALAAGTAIAGSTPAVFAALATDGIDGPTDAAGAVVDHQTTDSLQKQGIDVESYLADDDAYPALNSANALIRTGATGTNVGDIWFGWKAGG